MKQQLFVTHGDCAWTIAYKGRLHGPYQDRRAAVRHAVGLGIDAGRCGADVEVLVAGDDHRFRVEWTYLRDEATASCMEFERESLAPSLAGR